MDSVIKVGKNETTSKKKKRKKNSQGKDPSTSKGNSQGWRVQKKRKEEKWRKSEEKKKEEKKKVKYRKRRWWKKCEEFFVSLYMLRMKKGRKEKESKRREKRTKARQTLGKFGKWRSVLFAVGTELAMCQCCTRRTTEKDGGDGEDAAGSACKRRQMEIPQRWRQPRGEDWAEKMEERVVRCALLSGSAWSTEEDAKESAISSLRQSTE